MRVRACGEVLGLRAHDAVRLATAVSEVARNAVVHGRGGELEVALDDVARRVVAVVRDRGPGIEDPRAALARGPGLEAAKRVLDDFELVSAPGRGTSVRMIVA